VLLQQQDGDSSGWLPVVRRRAGCCSRHSAAGGCGTAGTGNVAGARSLELVVLVPPQKYWSVLYYSGTGACTADGTMY
jgi:hypothetical protein